MNVSEQVDALQKKAAALKSSFDQARQETNEQVKARIDQRGGRRRRRPRLRYLGRRPGTTGRPRCH
jgi:hypothetical protein